MYDLYLKSLQTNNIHIIHQHPSGAETRLYVPGRGGPLVWGDMEGRYNQIIIICHHRHQPTFWQTLVYIRPKYGQERLPEIGKGSLDRLFRYFSLSENFLHLNGLGCGCPLNFLFRLEKLQSDYIASNPSKLSTSAREP